MRHEGEPTVSVVLCVRNGAGTLGEQIGSLRDQTYTGWWELVLVDNASTDDSVAVATSSAAGLRMRVIGAFDGSGPAYAKNVGVAAAAGDLIAFCDADDRADPEWLAELVTTASTADMVGGFVDIATINDPVVRQWRPEYPRNRLPFPGPAVHGANMAIWKDVFVSVGGCDEGLTAAAGDEIDLSWRVRRAGYQLAFAPRAVMHYRLRHTLRGQARQMFAYGRADTYLTRRHGEKLESAASLLLLQLRMICVAPRYVWSPVGRGRWVRSAAKAAGRLAERVADGSS